MTAAPLATQTNRLLATVPEALLHRVGAREVCTKQGEILVEADTTPNELYFPHFGAVMSLVRVMRDGGSVESCALGWDGIATAQQILERGPEPNQIIVQVEGTVTAVDAERFCAELRANPALREPFLSYAAKLIRQMSQNVACNRLHDAGARLAKWLLLVRQRAGRDDVHLTHEFLSHMLGVRRAGVSEAVGAFASEGLIVHARNRISIRDVGGLHARACECAEALLANV